MTRRQTKILLWSFAAIICVSVAPVALTFAAVLFAQSNGCTMSALGPEPCLVGGVDWGGLLSVVFVGHWLALATIPLGGLAMIVWLVVAAAFWWRGRNTQA